MNDLNNNSHRTRESSTVVEPAATVIVRARFDRVGMR
jgi:hypothetical protein